MLSIWLQANSLEFAARTLHEKIPISAMDKSLQEIDFELKLGPVLKIEPRSRLYNFFWLTFNFGNNELRLGFNCLNRSTDKACTLLTPPMLNDSRYAIVFTGLAKICHDEICKTNLHPNQANDLYPKLQKIASDYEEFSINHIEKMLNLSMPIEHKHETFPQPYIAVRYKSGKCILDLYARQTKGTFITYKEIPNQTDKLTFIRFFQLSCTAQ